MVPHETVRRPPKSLAEGAVCFGSVVLILVVAAIVIEWALHLLP